MRPHQLAAVALAIAPSTRMRLHSAQAAFADAFDVRIDDALQVVQAAQFVVVRRVVVQIGGRRAGAGAEDKAERVVKVHIVNQLHHLVEVVLRSRRGSRR